jgi:hypothetical protein
VTRAATPTELATNAATATSAATRPNTTSGRHHGHCSFGAGQVGLIATPPNGSGGRLDQSCTGKGDHGCSWADGMRTVSNGLLSLKVPQSEPAVGEHGNSSPGLLDYLKIKISNEQAGGCVERLQHLAAGRDDHAVADSGWCIVSNGCV